MKAFLISVAVLTAFSSTPALAKRPIPSATARAPLSSLPEVQQFVQASRNLDAAVESGVNMQEYSRLVVELTAASSALDEALEPMGRLELREQITNVLRTHQRAKDFWNACLGDRAVSHSLINTSVPDSLAAAHATQLLRDFPTMNQDTKSGGALVFMDGRTQPLVYQDAVLSILWNNAGNSAKSLRQQLR